MVVWTCSVIAASRRPWRPTPAQRCTDLMVLHACERRLQISPTASMPRLSALTRRCAAACLLQDGPLLAATVVVAYANQATTNDRRDIDGDVHGLRVLPQLRMLPGCDLVVRAF